jgi:hypothetical protein
MVSHRCFGYTKLVFTVFIRPAAKAAVSGVSNAILRGYKTVEEAEAAYEFARVRCWTRSFVAGSCCSTSFIPSSPVPTQPNDTANPLHGSESLDNTWYVVYHGIVPGVYHFMYVLVFSCWEQIIDPFSRLEALLNTAGISKALYESVEGKAAAFDLFNAALLCGETAVAAPPNYYVVLDV